MDMSELDLEIGFVTGKQLPGLPQMESSEIPAGKYVTSLYKGPYKDMIPLYEAMKAWMIDRHLDAEETAYELYYNSPMEVPESELLTRVMFRVKHA